MIRINLIAERKAAVTKTARKQSQVSSELQENLILIVCFALAIVAFLGRRHMVNKAVATKKAVQSAKQAEYDKVKIWKEKQLDYEIRKELLNDKINRISQLKDRREGPVKLLEDIFNNIPSSVYLMSIEQGYDQRLIKSQGRSRPVFSPGNNIGNPREFKLTGYSKTMDAAGTLANRIFLIPRYRKGDLSKVEVSPSEETSDYSFTIYFETTADKKGKVAQDGGGS